MDYEAQCLLQEIEALRVRKIEDEEKKSIFDAQILQVKTLLRDFDLRAQERKKAFLETVLASGKKENDLESKARYPFLLSGGNMPNLGQNLID